MLFSEGFVFHFEYLRSFVVKLNCRYRIAVLKDISITDYRHEQHAFCDRWHFVP